MKDERKKECINKQMNKYTQTNKKTNTYTTYKTQNMMPHFKN